MKKRVLRSVASAVLAALLIMSVLSSGAGMYASANGTPAPELSSAATNADGTKIILTFDKDMADPTGKEGEFSVTVGGSSSGVTAAALASGDSKKIELTLAMAVKLGQQAKISYTVGTVTSSDGGILASFSNHVVTNNSWSSFHEDFQSYSENTYPSTFELKYNGTGEANQKVIIDPTHGGAGNKVFRLEGRGSWASEQYVSLPDVLPEILTIDAYAKPLAGGWPGAVDLVDYNEGSWGTRIIRVKFYGGKIYATNGSESSTVEIGTYETGKWYRITIECDTVTKKYNVYIDGNQVRTDLAMHSLPPKQFSLTAGNTGTNEAYFDDVTISAGHAIFQPLFITVQPTDQKVALGGKATFTVAATGDEPLSYQWKKGETVLTNGGNISGATEHTLAIANAQASDEGSYTCVVSNAQGSAVSNPAALRINKAPKRKTGILGTDNANAIAGSAYTIDLSGIFEDDDSDPLTYKVSVNSSDFVEAAESYSYTPEFAGTTELIFKANDGTEDSTDTYTVNLTAAAVPGIPQNFTSSPSNSQVELSWSAPTNDGGSQIIKYQVSNDGSNWIDVTSGTSYTFTDLTNGQSYTFEVVAVNSVGSGAAETITAIPQAPVTLQTAIADGASGAAASTKIDLVFDMAVTGLTADYITIGPGTGSATKGALTGFGTSWSIAISGVKEGTVSVAVASPTGYSISGAPKTVNVYGEWTHSGGGGVPPVPTYNADVKAGNGTETPLPVTVDKNSGSASVDVGTGSDLMFGGKTAVITVPFIPGVDTYTLGVPVPNLTTPDEQGEIAFNTDSGSVIVPSNMLTGVAGISGNRAQITIGKGDKSNLSTDIKAAIGNRPLIRLMLSIDGRQTYWSNPHALVTVSIPYTPTAAERAKPGSIVVWYIDGSGKVVSVPNGRYDPATGAVTFLTTHFSYYAVAYVHKAFSDLSGAEWAREAIETLASKNILRGASDGKYRPLNKVTKADFIYSMVRTFSAYVEFDEGFDDVQSDDYFYNEIGVAKKLGITSGSGDNKLNPDSAITKQDMMVLVARALEMYKGLEITNDLLPLDRFSDKGDIAGYAENYLATMAKEGLIAETEDKLNPNAYATRADAAALLYGIYDKYPGIVLANKAVDSGSGVTRLAGSNRVDTALAIAKATYVGNVANVVLATASDFPDALAGCVLADKLDAPILLVWDSKAERQKVLSYLKAHLEPGGAVYILGGTGAIDSIMESEIAAEGFRDIIRVAGEDRYETSAKISEKLGVREGTPVILASGEDYPDALSVGSVAAYNRWPIMLVNKNNLTNEVKQCLSDIKPNKVYIIGLEGAISQAVEDEVGRLTGLKAEDIIRIGGTDRYETSLAVARYFDWDGECVCIATGKNFPDAVAGSVYAAKHKAPIILAGDGLTQDVADFIKSKGKLGAAIFGGDDVVSDDIKRHIEEIIAE